MRLWAAAFLLLAASSRAADEAPVVRLMPMIKPLGAAEWGRDGYFKLKWEHTASGRFAGVDAAPSRREIWVVASPDYKENAYTLTALDAHGEAVREARIEARIQKLRVWEAGGKMPRLAVMDQLGVAAFDGKDGTKLFSDVLPRAGPSDIAALGKGDGGPALVVSYEYADFGLRALDAKGREKWRADFIPRSKDLAAARLSGNNAVAAADGLGKIFLVSPKGKILDRVLGPGNMDRVAFAGPRRLYGLDSGAGSWTEVLCLFSRDPRAKKPAWTLDKSLELGPITVTAQAVGRFGSADQPQLALGTDNGWVFLLDDAGAVLTQARFRGKIASLNAVDLDGDGRDELVVAVANGYSGQILAFSRPAAVSAR